MNDSRDLLLLIIIPAGLVFTVVLTWAIYTWQHRRSTDLIDAWAGANGYKILSREQPLLAGPFLWRRTRGQTVYRLQVEDGSGRQSTAWARCGHWFWGLQSDEITVEWEKTDPDRPVRSGLRKDPHACQNKKRI